MRETLRLAWRRLLFTPLFTLFALGVLALGIGATTATFSLVNAVLFRPLPYPQPDRLTFVWEAVRGKDVQRRSVSFPDFQDWRREARSFEVLSAFAQPSFTVSYGDTVERIEGELVSTDYFKLVGMRPRWGRVFTADEDRTLGGHPVAIISSHLWQRSFGGNPAIVGTPIRVNGLEFTVVGVMGEGFRGVTGQADLWVPMMMMREAIPELAGIDATTRRDVRWFAVLGRLKPGVTRAEAEAEMVGIARRLESTYPENDKLSAMVVPLDRQLLGDIRPVVVLLLGIVGLVLLIVCANLASLLLTRGLARQQEVAIQAALGASRGKMIRDFLAESFLLALVGGGIGILFAAIGLQIFSQAMAENIPSFLKITVDWRVLGFGFLLASGTGLGFGLWPALVGSKARLHYLSRDEGNATASRERSRSRFLLLTGEIALALALMAGAGLFLKAIRMAGRLDMGYETADRLTLRIDLPAGQYSPAQTVVFGRELEEEVRSVPGVTAAALTSDLPLGDRQTVALAFLAEPGAEKEAGVKVYRHAVTPGFFRTLGITVLRGRDFGPEDHPEATRTGIVSRGMADRLWPGRDPLGQRLRLTDLGSRFAGVTVVGVVDDVRFRSLAQDPNQESDLYVPFAQAPSASFGLVVQADAGADGVVAGVRKKVDRLQPRLPVYEVATLKERVAHEVVNSRVVAAATSVFSSLALGLAMFGLYGSLAYSASRRSKEMAIRYALGAQRTDLIRLSLSEGLRVAVLGIVLGLGLALLGAKALGGFLFGVKPSDPLVLLGVSLLVTLASLLASYLPARRATRVNLVTLMKS